MFSKQIVISAPTGEAADKASKLVQRAMGGVLTRSLPLCEPAACLIRRTADAIRVDSARVFDHQGDAPYPVEKLSKLATDYGLTLLIKSEAKPRRPDEAIVDRDVLVCALSFNSDTAHPDQQRKVAELGGALPTVVNKMKWAVNDISLAKDESLRMVVQHMKIENRSSCFRVEVVVPPALPAPFWVELMRMIWLRGFESYPDQVMHLEWLHLHQNVPTLFVE